MDLADDSLAGQHLGTLALGIRHVLCTPLRVVRYVDRPDARADAAADRGAVSRQPRKRTIAVAATQRALEAFATEAAAPSKARACTASRRKRRASNRICSSPPRFSARSAPAHQSGSHFEVASASIPCRAIGGDFYDYFSLPGGAFGFALGDVAGKGPSAALLTARIQGIFASQVNTATSAAALMASVNEGLIHRSIRSRFATACMARLRTTEA